MHTWSLADRGGWGQAELGPGRGRREEAGLGGIGLRALRSCTRLHDVIYQSLKTVTRMYVFLSLSSSVNMRSCFIQKIT